MRRHGGSVKSKKGKDSIKCGGDESLGNRVNTGQLSLSPRRRTTHTGCFVSVLLCVFMACMTPACICVPVCACVQRVQTAIVLSGC